MNTGLLHRAAKWFHAVDRLGGRLARRRVLAVLVVGIVAFALNVLIAALTVIKPASVHDEHSYLLAADTFLHGRVANPTHPLWKHFETMHVLQKPMYASKYPPGQGLMLALGRLVGGRPILGVWLSAGLAAGATCWMLQGWFRPRTALLGGLLVAFLPWVVTWGRGYWGGLLPLLGGSLILGAMKRIEERPTPALGLVMGLGMAVLAITRPYEGVALSLIALGSLAVQTLRRVGLRGTLATWPTVVCLILPVATAVLGIAYYNAKVTGHSRMLPYTVYEAQYSNTPIFLFQTPANPGLTFDSLSFRRFESEIYREYTRQREMNPFRMYLFSWMDSMSTYVPLFCLSKKDGLSANLRELSRNLPIFLFEVPLFLVPCLLFSRSARGATLMLAAFSVALMLPTWKMPHYAAPALGLSVVLLLCSIRYVGTLRWQGKRVGRFLVRGAIVVAFVWPLLLLVVWPKLKKDMPDQAQAQVQVRASVLATLKASGGRHLLIVRYAPDHVVHDEWVYNEADIDGAPVVWARDRGGPENLELLDYFRDRQIWLIEPDKPNAKPVPYR